MILETLLGMWYGIEAKKYGCPTCRSELTCTGEHGNQISKRLYVVV